MLGTISEPPSSDTTAQMVTMKPNAFVSDEVEDTLVTSEGFTALRRLIEGELGRMGELNQHRMQKPSTLLSAP